MKWVYVCHNKDLEAALSIQIGRASWKMALSHLSAPSPQNKYTLKPKPAEQHLLYETERLDNKNSQWQNLAFLLCLLEDRQESNLEPGAVISQCYYKTG